MSAEIKIIEASTSNLTHTFTIALDASQIDVTLRTRLERLRHTARVKGFRAGKVPLQILRGHFGTRLTQEVVDQLAVSVSRKIIADRGLRPVSRPVIDAFTKLESGEFHFKLIIEVFPEVALKPLEGLQIRQLTAAPDAKRIAIARDRFQLSDSALPPEEWVAGRLRQLSRLHLKRQVLDWLAARYDFDVPHALVERELSRILKGHPQELGEAIDSELERRYRGIAQRRIRLAIVLVELGRAHSVHVPVSDIDQLVRRNGTREEDHRAALISFYSDHPTARAELQSPLLEDAVVDFILGRSDFSERRVSGDELAEAAGVDIFDLE